MSENTELKNHAREIQDTLNLGYMKSLKLAEDIASIRDTRIAPDNCKTALTDAYFLPLAMTGKHWIMCNESNYQEPYRWLELFNIDLAGNYLAPSDPNPVSLDFICGDSKTDYALDSFDEALKIRLTIPFEKSFANVVNALKSEPRDHLVKDTVTIEIPLPFDTAGKIWTLLDVSRIVEQNMDWAEFGPVIPSKLNEL